MKLEVSSYLMRFLGAKYHPDWELITWHPRGILDETLVDEIVEFIETQEGIVEVPPFNRYTDLSGLTQIRLKIGHMFETAERRRRNTLGLPPVKSAFFCDKIVGFGMARMYEALLKDSSIHVRAFRERESVANWLKVPLEVLLED